MSSKETWTKTLENGRNVKFTYQELGPTEAEITAKVDGNGFTQGMKRIVGLPLTHDDVERQFAPSAFIPRFERLDCSTFTAGFTDCEHTHELPLIHSPYHVNCFVCQPELRGKPIKGECPACWIEKVGATIDSEQEH